ncbi:MAG: hypothetical protein ACRD9R_11240 [Pyrinomonadaceae bacterium]
MNLVSPHVPFTVLADLAEGLAPAARAAEARAHLEACAHCAAALGRLRRAVELMRSDRSEDAPSHAIVSAVSLFRRRRATDVAAETIAAAVAGARRLVAALTFDSHTMSPAFGIRAGQPQTARQLLFNAGENDLDLRITPGAGETWVVAGQVLGSSCVGGESGGSVVLSGHEETAETALDQLCEFKLPSVSAGTYSLSLTLPGEIEVVVPALELGD